MGMVSEEQYVVIRLCLDEVIGLEVGHCRLSLNFEVGGKLMQCLSLAKERNIYYVTGLVNGNMITANFIQGALSCVNVFGMTESHGIE
jgi:hypothetical protein